jgi:hypothetical protein
MSGDTRTSQDWIVEKVRDLVSSSVSGLKLIEAMDGVHPIEIKNALIRAGESVLLERVFDDLVVSCPVMREIVRDDNPVLSFWPFASSSAREISKRVSSYRAVALLGVPTVFGALNERGQGDAILFDTDDYLFQEDSVHGHVKCDILSGVPDRFESQFDLVLGDPPWYFEEYCSWLRAAIRLCRPGGVILFVLFPPGIRRGAESERNSILDVAQELLEDVEILPDYVLYETPSFEAVELIRSGIFPVNWRKAQLWAGKVRADKEPPIVGSPRLASEAWIERRVGCGRLFIKNEPANIDAFLASADPKSRFLSSPSRRNIGRASSNVLSSRGHGLRCSDPHSLIARLEGIRSSDDLRSVGEGLEPASADLLRSVVTDLWSRYITIDQF